MKRIILSFFILTSALVNCQNQANWWFFGQNAGLNFNNFSPTAVQGELDTIEGSASISNACGDLLFYTDGINVWDRNGVIMPNGQNLLGDPSSTQSAIIIPLPESDHIYYVITVSLRGADGLNYSVIDMNLNNGNGDIVANQKNINLLSNTSEKIVATPHSNGRDIWLVNFGERIVNSGIFERFTSFKITPSGFDFSSTVFSNLNQIRTTDSRGYMRISANGDKIAFATQGIVNTSNPAEAGVGAWLLDFDNNIGRVNNPIRLNFNATNHAYGVEFSSNGSKLYLDLNTQQGGVGSNGYGERSLLQYDLNINNFENNPILIFETDPLDPDDNLARGALQRGPNNKIYYARPNDEWLSLIDNPNNNGAACNFIYDGIALLNGTLSKEGLPPFSKTEFNPTFNVIEGCAGSPTLFNADLLAACPNATITWDFDDPSSGNLNSSNLQNPEHTFNSIGTYRVQMTITTAVQTYTAERNLVINDVPLANPLDDIIICDGIENDGIALISFTPLRIQVLGNQSFANYTVSFYDSLSNANLAFNSLNSSQELGSGTYYARIENRNSPGCFETTDFEINILPYIDIVNSTELIECDGPENDGLVIFDLEMNDLLVLNNIDPNDVNTSFYPSNLDAVNQLNRLPRYYENRITREEIFLRIEYRNLPSCSYITSFFIEVIPLPVVPFIETYEICDDLSGDGIEVFDLTFITNQIQNAHNFPILVEYYNTEQNALNESSALSNQYTNVDRQETLWIRTSNGSNDACYELSPLEIRVHELPLVTDQEDVQKCNGEETTLQAFDGYETYLWSTGEDSSSISVTDPGIYEVTAGDMNGCTASKTIVVNDYEATQITNIIVEQYRINTNRIEIIASGGGDLFYSLNGFTYQGNNFFENLLPGIYNIHVKGANNCNVATQLVSIVAARPFFSPNGDGFNDFWQIIEIDKIPSAKVLIFDRFGKLLKKLSASDKGWDGNYNGNPMPSSDYWYQVQLPSGIDLKGHFSLIR